MIVGTRALKMSKLEGRTFKVKVGENTVEETKDEKLLGVLMSDSYSWNSHLYGNGKKGKEKVLGLIPKLSQRVGMLGKLNKYMSRDQFRATCD